MSTDFLVDTLHPAVGLGPIGEGDMSIKAKKIAKDVNEVIVVLRPSIGSDPLGSSKPTYEFEQEICNRLATRIRSWLEHHESRETIDSHQDVGVSILILRQRADCVQRPLFAHFDDFIEPRLRLVIVLPTVRHFLTKAAVAHHIFHLALQIGPIVPGSQQLVDCGLHLPVACNFSMNILNGFDNGVIQTGRALSESTGNTFDGPSYLRRID
jgi:hypothetical protein